MVPVADIITGFTSLCTFHMRYIAVVRSLYFKIFLLLLDHISVSRNGIVCYQTFFFHIITEWFCHFSLADAAIRLPNFHDFFLVPSAHAQSSVPCLMLPLSSYHHHHLTYAIPRPVTANTFSAEHTFTLKVTIFTVYSMGYKLLVPIITFLRSLP